MLASVTVGVIVFTSAIAIFGAVYILNRRNKTNRDKHSLAKLQKRLQKSLDATEHIIIVVTGAYSPVHRMHIQCLEDAKRYFEQERKQKVLAGFISPSHDHYLLKKLGAAGIRGTHRLEMLRRVLASSDWIDVDDWECNQETSFSALTMVRSLSAYIRLSIPSLKFKMVYLCGADLMAKNGYRLSLGWDIGLAVVARPGHTEELETKIAQKSEIPSDFHLIKSNTEDISSTMIRKKMASGEDISSLTYPAVCEYLRKTPAAKLYLQPGLPNALT